MKEDSGFFEDPSDYSPGLHTELIHSSVGGWTELYRIDRSGRFRILKVLKPSFRGILKYEEALRKEFEIGYSLSSPGICETYQFLYVEGLGNCIEMEWVDGMPLSEILSRGRPSRSFSRRIALQLCDALAYIHSKQIVHRDIKPSNILITHNGHNVKLIDFGLSDSDSYSMFKAPAGTVSFAAPEMMDARRCQIDNRADIYSLGKVMALMSPFYGSTARKCTRKNPELRYQNAEQLKRAIEHKSLKSWGILLCAAAAAASSILLLFSGRQSAPAAVPHTEEPEVREATPVDTSAIDEIFRQATEMILYD